MNKIRRCRFIGLPAGGGSEPGAEGTTAWYLGPTRVAARGKIRSSGSTVKRISAPKPPPGGRTDQACLPQRCTACSHAVSPASLRILSAHPKYRKGHILKCFTSRASSFSASWRSFRGRPRPLTAGALVLTTFGCVGTNCRRPSCLSTSSSCRREHGAQVHPYPRLGFASSGGFTQLM